MGNDEIYKKLLERYESIIEKTLDHSNKILLHEKEKKRYNTIKNIVISIGIIIFLTISISSYFWSDSYFKTREKIIKYKIEHSKEV